MITLKITSGKKCDGCPFFSIPLFSEGGPTCLLFKEKLEYSRKYGTIDIGSIKKCDSCAIVTAQSE